MTGLDFISKTLLSWFDENKRDLPWRHTTDPYKIWISEIILQQTRVAQGMDYYIRFIRRFPDVRALASADEQEVLKYWQGLGYYSRARNLHRAAKTIVDQYDTIFPKDHKSILGLPGIGEYTAAAIVSFAWNMPYPAVDGNVFRFLSRLLKIDVPCDTTAGRKHFTEIASQAIDKLQPGAFNQAIMEFGALQCVPKSPDCGVCPFEANCLAHADGTVSSYPVKQNKTATKTLYLYYFHIQDKKSTYFRKRTDSGIWKNLYEFPLIESETPLEFEELMRHPLLSSLPKSSLSEFKLMVKDKKHVLSHRRLYCSFYNIIINSNTDQAEAWGKEFNSVAAEDIDKYPVHRLMQFYIDNHITNKDGHSK